MLVQSPSAPHAQTGPNGPFLSPPSLPPTLPGGVPLPVLPPGAQAEILQRILDGAQSPAGRPAPAPSYALPAPAPVTPAFARPGPAVAAPPPPAAPAEPLSPAEAFFAAREAPDAGKPPLRQFGYDGLAASAPPLAPQQGFGAVPEDYLIGRDDELVLAFRGRARQTMSLRVGRDGALLVPDLAPIPAAGRRLRDLRADLEARAMRDLGGSEVFLSLGQLRQMAVFVGGEVQRPGVQALTSLSSVLDALAAAGGVRRTGSLRAIRVEGPGGARRIVDLYPVVAGEGGAAPDLMLREGERILVPPLGGAVAVGGEVTRPGIYELPAGAASAPLSAVLALAGQPLRPAGNRFVLDTTDGAGRRSLHEIGPRDALRRGDALRVEPGTDVAAGRIRLAGHVSAPLTRAAGGGRGGSLRALLSDPRLVRPDPYPRLGVVWRTDARTRTRRFLPFDLARVLRGGADLPLAEGDEVVLLGQADVLWLSSPGVQQALRGEAGGAAADDPAFQTAPASGAQPIAAAQPVGTPAAASSGADCPALTTLAVAARASRGRFAHARSGGFPDIGRLPCPAVFVEYPLLLPFLLDQAVLLTGEVGLPGLYPVTGDTGLDAVLAAAGGAADTADLSTVELSREPAENTGALPLTRLTLDLRSRNFAAIRLSPRDAVRLPRGFADRDTGPVTLTGEFLRPGSYDIRRGERLSEVIARAGGLTPQAYPYGAVFTRESVRARQQEGFARSARELEQGLMQVAAGQAVAGVRGGGGTDLGGAIAAGRELANSLRGARAAGRMVVEANPVLLAGRPELDVLLEPGDLIAIPKRPNEVTVVGSVLNPGSLQFATGWRAADYVRAAGGEQRFADPGRAFVVLPNGQSVPAGLGAWQAGGPPVPPGSLVVVPQDPSPYENWGFLRDATQVLSQIALSTAALAVIVRTGSAR
ncbi:hypothetical protein GCM10009416_43420 [Craurococcus roseus]|uniref:Soluble ligand binding domain-containing protein n=2 Tax=Craurococcus roseus TaxID=77585 RepID=A0ABP3QZV0_9PROT